MKYYLGLALSGFLFSACANPVIVTQKVLVPIKCDIVMPKKATPPNNLTKPNLAIWLTKASIAYQKELENALRFCIGGE